MCVVSALQNLYADGLEISMVTNFIFNVMVKKIHNSSRIYGVYVPSGGYRGEAVQTVELLRCSRDGQLSLNQGQYIGGRKVVTLCFS